MYAPDTIDRIAPTFAPDQPVVMYQNWHHLLFLHWEIPASELRAMLPPGLELDTFDGHAYVGLVPFTVSGARPVLMPSMPGVSSFHEVNVRTYVHCKGKDPGVWFFSLDASSPIAVAAARATYKLPYFHSEIDMSVSDAPLPEIRFRSRRADATAPAATSLAYAPEEGAVRSAVAGTLDFFLLERYVLYAADGEGNLYRARVHHQPYPMRRVRVSNLEDTLVWSAGIRIQQNPHLQHYASEVNVNVYPLESVRS